MNAVVKIPECYAVSIDQNNAADLFHLALHIENQANQCMAIAAKVLENGGTHYERDLFLQKMKYIKRQLVLAGKVLNANSTAAK